MPPAFEVYLVLVVAHRPQALFGIVDFQLTQILKRRSAVFFGPVLHVLLRGSFLLGFVDVGVPASSVCWICEAIDLYLAGFGLVFEEGLSEVPRG